MKLLQNSAGNFLNMAPQEAINMARQLLDAAEKCLTTEPGRGAGFVHTIVIQEHRFRPNSAPYYGELDTVFMGISRDHIDVHSSLEADLKSRKPHILNIDRSYVNVRLKEGSSHESGD